MGSLPSLSICTGILQQMNGDLQRRDRAPKNLFYFGNLMRLCARLTIPETRCETISLWHSHKNGRSSKYLCESSKYIFGTHLRLFRSAVLLDTFVNSLANRYASAASTVNEFWSNARMHTQMYWIHLASGSFDLCMECNRCKVVKNGSLKWCFIFRAAIVYSNPLNAARIWVFERFVSISGWQQF